MKIKVSKISYLGIKDGKTIIILDEEYLPGNLDTDQFEIDFEQPIDVLIPFIAKRNHRVALRCYNGMRRSGVNKLKDLLQLKPFEVQSLKNIGARSKTHIVLATKDFLIKQGFTEEEICDFPLFS